MRRRRKNLVRNAGQGHTDEKLCGTQLGNGKWEMENDIVSLVEFCDIEGSIAGDHMISFLHPL